MTGFNRKQCIDNFIRWLRQPFVNVFPVSTERATRIAADYFPAVRAITDDMVQEVVRIMQQSITAHAGHDRIREWKRCCRGVADYILRPAKIDGVHRLVAAGVLVRLSGYIRHCPGFFGDFRPAAIQMDNVMQFHLPYLKTGGDITIDTDCVDKDGYITLWNFAKGSKHEVRRSEPEIRTLSSRILNFICLHHYSKVRITRSSYAEINKSFDHDEHTLYRWSVGDKWVDFIAHRLKVPADDLFGFLYPPEQSDSEDFDPDFGFDPDIGFDLDIVSDPEIDCDDDPAPNYYGSRPTFDPNQMYKPDRDRRFDWFNNEWNIAADPTCLTPDGYVTLWNFWNFAKKSPDEQDRKVSEIRKLATRLLNFLCINQYRDARLAQKVYEALAKRDDDPLVNRSLATVMVRCLQVPASSLPAFLQGAVFDAKQTYNPDRQRRQEWFTKELKSA